MTTTPASSPEVVKRTGKPTTAGILSIIAGVVAFLLFILIASTDGPEGVGGAIAGLSLIAVGILAIIGGVFTLRRRIWGLALAGAICAILTSLVLGIPAVILIVMARQEFK